MGFKRPIANYWMKLDGISGNGHQSVVIVISIYIYIYRYTYDKEFRTMVG